MNTSPSHRRLSRGGASTGRCSRVTPGTGSLGPRMSWGDAGCRGARRRSPTGFWGTPAGSRTRGGAFTDSIGLVLHVGFGGCALRYLDAVELFDGFTAQDDFRVR